MEATHENAVPAPEPKKDESVVDAVFDAITGVTARGLDGTRRALEASARWLDGRAKVVGDLATKLAP